MRSSGIAALFALAACSSVPAHAPPTASAPPPPRSRSPYVVRVTSPSPHQDRVIRTFSATPDTTDAFDALVLKHAERRGLNPRLVKAIIAAESEFRIQCVSYAGARGLMQLMPETAEEMGILREQIDDPEANIKAGTAYLQRLFRSAWIRYHLKGRYRNAPHWVLQRVVAAYYQGPRALSSKVWKSKTKKYVHTVMIFYRSPVSRLRKPVPEPDVIAARVAKPLTLRDAK